MLTSKGNPCAGAPGVAEDTTFTGHVMRQLRELQETQISALHQLREMWDRNHGAAATNAGSGASQGQPPGRFQEISAMLEEVLEYARLIRSEAVGLNATH